MVGVKDSLLAHSSDPVEMRRLNYQTQGMDAHTPISTSSFTHDSRDHLEVRRCKDLLSLWVWEYSICIDVRQHRGGPAHFPALLQRSHSMIFPPFLRSIFYPSVFYFTTFPLLKQHSQCHNTATPVGFPSKCSHIYPNLHNVSN